MSSVNPEDINAFAGMLGKLNQIQEGRKGCGHRGRQTG
jgi:hypothetical protein